MEDLLVQHDRELKRLRHHLKLRQTVQSSSADAAVSERLESIPNEQENLSNWSNVEDPFTHGTSRTTTTSQQEANETNASKRRRVVFRSPSIPPPQESAFSGTNKEQLGGAGPSGSNMRPFIHHSRPPSEAPSLADHNAALVLEASGSTGGLV